MVSCVAYGCKNRSDKNKRKAGVTFHRFPRNQEIKLKWINAVRRKNWHPHHTSVICSEHFRDEDMDRTSLSTVRVRENAIPSIFPAFPVYLRKQVKPRKSPYNHKVEDPASTSQITEYEINIEDEHIESALPCVPIPVQESPEKQQLKLDLQFAKAKIVNSQKKIKVLQQKERRMKQKFFKFNNIIQGLKHKRLLADDQLSILDEIGKTNSLLLERQLNKNNKQKYPPELRSFSLNLHFFSPRAYKFVRKQFNTCLPHPRTISKWYKCIDARPGFHQEALETIKQQVKKSAGNSVICALMFDEMAIRKHLEWDGERYHGYVDFGANLDNDSIPVAKEALTFLLVCINQHWKLPIGYFLIDGMNGEQRCSLIKQSLIFLHETGVKVVSLTFDGISSNISAAIHLGCSFDGDVLNTSFVHPVTREPVNIFLDPCHMLKLVRNTLGDKKIIFDANNNKIEWKYIEQLHILQENDGMVLGNKLRAAHINWKQQKMKVKLATQLFSNSVANAIDYCSKIGVSGFEKSTHTIFFIKLFNDLFDILNSRSVLQRDMKKPLCSENIAKARDFLNMADKYIINLKEKENGTALCKSNRKIGFIGFRVCIQSSLNMYEHLFNENSSLQFLPLYRISQDHLELFFGCIRSKGGFNNNPTTRQFQSAYKKLLIHYQLHEPSKGNCTPLEPWNILTCSTRKTPVDVINETSRADMIEKDNLITPPDHDYVCLPGINLWSEFTESIVAYIAGFVVRWLEKILHCETCINSLRELDRNAPHIMLIQMQSRGRLIYPSKSVFCICKEAEKIFRRKIAMKGDNYFNTPGSLKHTTSEILQYFIGSNVFDNLKDHSFDQSPFESHVVHLIQAICDKYLNVKIHHHTKILNERQHRIKIRQKLTKIYLFRGQ